MWGRCKKGGAMTASSATNSFTTAIANPATSEKTTRKLEKKKMKAHKKAKKSVEERKSSPKALAATFPMIALIDEPARKKSGKKKKKGKALAAALPKARTNGAADLEEVPKQEKKELKKKLKEKKSSTKQQAKSFPMIALIDEQVRTSIPKELVAKVKHAKSKRHIISSGYPYKKQMKNSDYMEEIELLHIELVKMQTWVKEVGERIVLLFEGRDAAGKGGTIQRFTENLNPRGAKVVALAKPSDTERGQWYYQRYVERLPTKGEIVFFDRSWYNRSGVEHVMGFCTPHEYLEFMRQTPEFERMMVRSGIRLFKFWFSVSREEQLRRFLGRAKDPVKQWKLSPMDVESLGRWESYTKAKEAMLFYTDTADAPWTIVRSDDKKRARLNAIKYILHTIPYEGKDTDIATAPDPRIVGSAKAIYEQGENPHSHPHAQGHANHASA